MKNSTSKVSPDQMVRVGVLSDSHGEAHRTRRAVEELARLGASVFIHCGDIESIECLDPLAGLDAHLVFGNCDEPSELADYAASLGIQVHPPLGHISVNGTSLAFTHGDRQQCIIQALNSHTHWLFHGHTHTRRDEIVRATRVVNPGALHRASPYSVALITPQLAAVQFIEIA